MGNDAELMNSFNSRYPAPPVSSLPEDLQNTINAVEEKAGFVPDVFAKLSRRPDEFRAFFAYHDALMERESGLTKGEREMIVVATSALNDCLYCVVAHGAIARIREKNAILADQLATDYTRADITDKQIAMLDFACKVARNSAAVSEVDFALMRQHGFNDEDIWDIGAITAFFAMSNRLASISGMLPNTEFYSMGR